MKKLVMFVAVVAGFLGCAREYRFCDEHTQVCYVCDGVGCSTVPGVPVVGDAGDRVELVADAPTVDASDVVGPAACYANVHCIPGSRCVAGECRLMCSDIDDCLAVDVSFSICDEASHLCLP